MKRSHFCCSSLAASSFVGDRRGSKDMKQSKLAHKHCFKSSIFLKNELQEKVFHALPIANYPRIHYVKSRFILLRKFHAPFFVPYAFLRVCASFCPVVVLASSPKPKPKRPRWGDCSSYSSHFFVALCVRRLFSLFPLSLSLFLWASNWVQGSWIGFYRLKRYEHIKNTYSAPYHFGKIS